MGLAQKSNIETIMRNLLVGLAPLIMTPMISNDERGYVLPQYRIRHNEGLAGECLPDRVMGRIVL